MLLLRESGVGSLGKGECLLKKVQKQSRSERGGYADAERSAAARRAGRSRRRAHLGLLSLGEERRASEIGENRELLGEESLSEGVLAYRRCEGNAAEVVERLVSGLELLDDNDSRVVL